MKWSIFSAFLFLLVFTGSVSGQMNPRQLKADATSFFNNGKYPESLNLFLKYQRLNPDDEEIKSMIGICYYHTNELTNARKYLQFVISNDKKLEPIIYYYLANVYHAELDFANAIRYYKEFLRNTKKDDLLRESTKDQIRRCATGMRLQSQEEIAVVESLGDKINTPYDEFAPIISPNYEDKIYFSSARPSSSGGQRNEQGLVDERYGFYRSDMYSSVVVNGEWSEVYPFGSLLNSARNDVILDFSETGSVMFFFKGNDYYSGQILVDSFSKTEQNLYPSPFQGPAFGEEGDRDLFFFKDSILLFSSYRPGGFGGSDLYISTYTRAGWSPAKNLGSTINSAYDERTPFLSRDGRTLYFSSNNSKSLGGLDVFKARYDDHTTSWSEPVNLGVPINSAGDDAFFRLSKDGLKAFFSSSRKQGMGQRDLFVAYFKGFQNEQRKSSIPVAFHFVPEFKRLQQDGTLVLSTTNSTGTSPTDIPVFHVEELKSYEFSSLYFGADENILTLNNTNQLNRVALLMIEYPQLKLQINSHYDGSSPKQFDLFFSIKRAEKAAEYLVQNGVKASNVFVKGLGSSYPVAQQMQNGANGQNFNRRLDLNFFDIQGLPIDIQVEGPNVQAGFMDNRGKYFDRTLEGLSYKVQVAAIGQNYVSDVILEYPDAQVESRMDENVYRYTVGWYKNFESAETLRRELFDKGLTDVFVVPYIDGVRIPRNKVSAYVSVYSDLANYLLQSGQ